MTLRFPHAIEVIYGCAHFLYAGCHESARVRLSPPGGETVERLEIPAGAHGPRGGIEQQDQFDRCVILRALEDAELAARAICPEDDIGGSQVGGEMLIAADLERQDDEIGLRMKNRKLRFTWRLLSQRGSGQYRHCEC